MVNGTAGGLVDRMKMKLKATPRRFSPPPHSWTKAMQNTMPKTTTENMKLRKRWQLTFICQCLNVPLNRLCLWMSTTCLFVRFQTNSVNKLPFGSVEAEHHVYLRPEHFMAIHLSLLSHFCCIGNVIEQNCKCYHCGCQRIGMSGLGSRLSTY